MSVINFIYGEDMKSRNEKTGNFYTIKGFSLLSVIVIILLTAIASAITTGVIANNNFKSKDGISYKELLQDKELSEFIDVYSSVISQYYTDVNKEEMVDAAISAMLNYLNDSYTTYMNPTESTSLTDKLAGQYHGIGVALYKNIVTSIFKKSPAEAAGLQVGDTIISINNTAVANLSNEDISKIIKENTAKDQIDLVISRNGEIMNFSLKTADLFIPALDYSMVENTKIGYIYISIFSASLTDQFKEALEELESQGMEKLIIDMRENTGGYLSQAESIASIFLKKDKKIYSLQQKEKVDDYYDKTDEFREYKIAVVVNGNTASAAEILAAALKDSYGAVIVGTKTYGKGKVQQTIKLQDNSVAKYTSAKWLRPNGECIDEIGILPDYPVEITYEKNEEGQVVSVVDTQIDKAIEILK